MYNQDQYLVLKVLSRIKERVEDDPEQAEEFAIALDHMLDWMLGNDSFGSEGSDDPRGDFRDDDWSIAGGNVQ